MPKAEDSPKEAPVLARCALKPGTAGEDQCDKTGDGYAIRGADSVPFFARLKSCMIESLGWNSGSCSNDLGARFQIHLRTGQLMR